MANMNAFQLAGASDFDKLSSLQPVPLLLDDQWKAVLLVRRTLGLCSTLSLGAPEGKAYRALDICGRACRG